jgi:SET domain-containing protein
MSPSKKKLLKHLTTEVYCRIGVSPLHGVGVFALRAIPRGLNPLPSWLDNAGVQFTHQELKLLPRGVKKQIKTFCYYDDDGFVIPSIGMNSFDMSIYLNHSKTPNVKMKKCGKFETLRAIRSGEELTMDYDHSFGDTHVF